MPEAAPGASGAASPGSDPPALRRGLGPAAATAVVAANMIGTGIFTSTGFLAGDLGSPGLILLAWLIGGLAATAGALCYAELATAFPESGGEYVYLRELFGPLPAFLSGWVSFVVGFSAPTAAAALALAAYLAPFVPELDPQATAPLAAWGPLAVRLGAAQLLALAVIGSLAAVHALGHRPGARAQVALTAFKVILLVVLVAAGFAFGDGAAENLVVAAPRTSGAPLPAAFAVGLVLVMFSYSGFNAAAYLGGEVRDPRRNLPRSLLAGTLLVAGLYMALNLLFLYALPAQAYVGRVNVGEIAAEALFGVPVARFFGLLMAGALLSTVSAMLLAGPRVTWAMAHRGAFPAWAARVDPRTGVPVRAIAIQAALAALMALTGTVIFLMTFIGFALSLFAAATVAGVFRLRRRGVLPAAYRAPLGPALPAGFCAVSLWMMAYAVVERPWESGAVLALMLLGVGVFALTGRGRSAAARSGP